LYCTEYVPHDHHHKGEIFKDIKELKCVKSSNYSGCNMKCRMYGTLLCGSHLSDPTDLMDRIDTYRDFKYLHNQKSTSVKSGDLE
ncbi:hypothetical protein TNCV_4885311, partial [Trichonephila clavipes]